MVILMIRDRLALLFIKWARRLTAFGDTDDLLAAAQDAQERWLKYFEEDDL